jgi:hypothetical protein
MTSIEWLIEVMLSKGYFKESVTLTNIDHLQYKAEEMHKQEIINTWYNGYINQSPMIDEENCGEKFYQETFVSKGSDDTLKDYHIVDTNEMIDVPQQEISDEEIEKASYKFWEFKEHTQSTCWKMGAKWYREQLKQK